MNRTIEKRGPRKMGRRARQNLTKRDGQILIVVLMAMTLLVGLIFFVYNTGELVNRRLAMQNAADSVAISGAGWMARSMNLTAGDNVGMAKLLSLVPLYDAMPLATQMSADEMSKWEECLDKQLQRGVPNDAQYLADGLTALRNRFQTQRDILMALNDQLNNSGFKMENLTNWRVSGASGPAPQGTLWQAVDALDNFSQAAINGAGRLAEADAYRFGGKNDVAAAFMVHFTPVLPAKRGEFKDFEPPLRGKEHVLNDKVEFDQNGGAGGAIPDRAFPHRLGPWARLLKWRDNSGIATGRQWIPGPGGPVVQPGHGSVNLSGRRVGGSAQQQSSGNGHWQMTGWIINGYTTYGPFDWALRRLNNYAKGLATNPGELRDAFWYEYVRDLARIKLGYMFNQPASLTKYHHPDWIVDYPQARLKAQSGVKVNRTMFYQVEIASRTPENGPGWLGPGTFRTNGQYPIAIWANGWVDPEQWHVPRPADYIWKDSYVYQTTEDPALGISAIRGANGQLVFQTVYMLSWYVFGGIDIGLDDDVTNPCNWNAGDSLPAPMLLDTTQGDYLPDAEAHGKDEGVRRDLFSFLGVVRKGTGASVWPQKFQTENPANSMFTFSQAKVFNNSSWCLWTQDWQVALTPVTQWQDWAAKLGDDISRYSGAGGQQVSVQELQQACDYMNRIPRSLAEKYNKK